MKIFVFITGVCLLSGCLGQDYQEVEEKPISRLRTPRGPIVPNRSVKQSLKSQSTTSTSTTTEAAPEEYDAANYDEEQQEAVTTTTEAPRKGIRNGVLRPFRSNTDLIEALKRRRAQAGSERAHSSTTTAQPAQSQDTTKSSRRSKNLDTSRKFATRSHHSTSTTETPPQDEPTQRSKYFAGRGRRF